jgi:hypothetical protein
MATNDLASFLQDMGKDYITVANLLDKDEVAKAIKGIMK